MSPTPSHKDSKPPRGPRETTNSSGLRLPLPDHLNKRFGRDGDKPGPDDNLGLWLDKLLRVDERDQWDLLEDKRVDELKRRVCPQSQSSSAAAQDANARTRHTAPNLYGAAAHHIVRAQTRGRLLVDYGRPSAQEASISLHHVWGCPRIPGSALKGLMRAWYRNRGLPDSDALFGTPDAVTRPHDPIHRRGRLVFHDAVPCGGAYKIALDVLTPHMGPYYRGDEPPAEWLSPVPHTFVTVVETTFEFVVGLLPPKGLYWREDTSGCAETLDGLVEQLRLALASDGVGAKRAAGYGRLDVISP